MRRWVEGVHESIVQVLGEIICTTRGEVDARLSPDGECAAWIPTLPLDRNQDAGSSTSPRSAQNDRGTQILMRMKKAGMEGVNYRFCGSDAEGLVVVRFLLGPGKYPVRVRTVSLLLALE